MSIHIGNLQLLMTEIFETKFDLNPPFVKDIFIEPSIPYNLKPCLHYNFKPRLNLG